VIKCSNISVIILTFNEEKHIDRCISSIIDIAADIFIVDCFSTDRTCEIAKSLGAKVYQHKWINHSTQFNWALKNLPITSDWVFRLDADEIVTDALSKQIVSITRNSPETITGIYIGRRVYFMNRWMQHGGTYPMYVMRLFRFGKGHCEQRWMDEHIKITQGATIRVDGDIIDDNTNNLGWWTNKHNHYALREAIDILNLKFRLSERDSILQRFNGFQDQRKRWLKTKYTMLPLFIRPFIYFLWRYFVKLGFLDGFQGLIWNFLQGFWYRFLVDAIIFEILSKASSDSESIKRVIEKEYEIKLI
jgi:glycosyltransferase involved in cell wall biosynthesis